MSSQPASKNGDREHLNRLIQGIFKHDKRIRFVSIYQDQNLLAGGMRPGVRSYDPEADAREIDLQLAKVGEITRAWQPWFGRLVRFTVNYEKITLAFHPLGSGRFLVISGEPEVNLSSLERVIAAQGYNALEKDVY